MTTPEPQTSPDSQTDPQADEAASQADEAASQADEAASQADEADSQADEVDSQAAPERAGPVLGAERIQTLDVLRGLALLGILFVNVSALVLPGDWFRVDWDDIGPIEYGVEVLKRFFTEGKFYTLFAFLFGVGFAIQLNRAEKKGHGFVLRYLWRTVLLFAIGIFHLIVIWDGDILVAYAIGGFLLMLCFGLKRLIDWPIRRFSKKGRKGAPTWVSLIGAGILIFGLMGTFGGFTWYAYQAKQAEEAGETLTEFQRKVVKQLKSINDPKKVAKREAKAAATNKLFAEGSYADALGYRAEHASERILIVPFWFSVTGLFILGAYFGRRRFFDRADQLQRGFKRLTVVAFAIGVPLSALFVWVAIAGGENRMPWWQFPLVVTKTTAGLAFALGMVGAVTVLMRGKARRWLLYLAPVGRMALSNYLLQSVIGTWVFYGHGLGLMEHLNAVAQLGYIAVLFAAQIAISRWWLQRYQFGPVEWLWRSLTYFRLQPMRRT